MLYNKIMEKNKQVKVAECQNIVTENIQTENVVNDVTIEDNSNNKQKINYGKKPLTAYQKYKNSRNQNGKKYFEFYDDVKVYTHNIWDW